MALDVIFAEIARKEEIKPDAAEEDRLAHALQSQGVDHETAHRYIRSTIMREKVWEVLGAKALSRVTEEKPQEPGAEAASKITDEPKGAPSSF